MAEPARRWNLEELEPRTLLSAGSLDPTFGNAGQLAVQFPGGESITVVRDSLVQPDGKVVVTGEAPDASDPGTSDFAVARLNPDGTPDLTFNGTGIFVYNSPGNIDEGSGVALQSDGKIVVSATFGETRTDRPDYGLFAVGRFNPDGTLDTTFGDGGAEVINFTQTNTTAQAGAAHDVLVGADNKITLIGYAYPDPSQSLTELALARLNADGTPDQTFGTGGKVLTSVLGGSEIGLSGAFDGAGNILVTGSGHSDTTVVPFLTARFLPTGQVDTSFGNGGAVETTFPGATDVISLAAGDAVAVQSDGSIVVGGLAAHADASANLTLNFALARYEPDGTPDFNFGDDGGQVESVLGPITSINKLLIDSEGRIIASGLSAATAADATARVFSPIVAQYDSDGFLDPTFGSGGVVTLNVNNVAPVGSAIAASPAAAIQAALAPFDVTPIGTGVPQQAASALQQQAAIAIALGNKILVVTNNSSGTLTAARLIGNGPDLAASGVTITKGGGSVMGGAKGALVATVTNVGNDPFSGPVTVSVVLSPTTDPAAAVGTAATASYTLRLSPGAGKTVKLKFAYPTGLPDGAYYVLAVANGGAIDVNSANNGGPTAAPVTVARPFVSLAGSLTAPATLIVDKKGIAVLLLQNGGNVPAKGTATVTLYASTDATFDAGDSALGTARTVHLGLKPAKSKATKVPAFATSGLAGPYFLIAVVDASAVPLINLAAITIVSGTETSVS